jgi:ferrous iron transport protein B
MVTNVVTREESYAEVVVVGRESVGKSQLIASLSGRSARASNFRGSTVDVERYRWNDVELVDTPGIHRSSDSAALQIALGQLQSSQRILLVVQATHLDDDLAELLPLVAGKVGMVVVTFWDKVQLGKPAIDAIEKLASATGVPFVVANARDLTDEAREQIRRTLQQTRSQQPTFSINRAGVRAGWRIEPRRGILDHRVAGPLIAIALLLAPALATIWIANGFAQWLHPIVSRWVDPLSDKIDASLPGFLATVLTAKMNGYGYGLLTMGPFLLVWALPTVLLFSLILAIYKSSGLIEHVNAAIHPWSRRIGLSGRDLVRIMMGFGCNVPAVISTRACSSCSRSTAIAAIAFGSACSYQLPATLAVLASAAQHFEIASWILPASFLSYLLITTCVYLRLVSPRVARSSLNLLLQPARPFLQWPTFTSVTREVWITLKQFMQTALPVFAIICILASLLTMVGAVPSIGVLLAPAMRVFNLPAEAAVPIVMASVRKDGIFLFAAPDGLAMPLSPFQVLTAVYLAGVLLPCIVTALAIRRESGTKMTMQILLRQAGFAIVCSIVLGWIGRLLST